LVIDCCINLNVQFLIFNYKYLLLEKKATSR